MNKGVMNSVKELSIDEVSKISASLGIFSKLLISGGEPFLRDDLPEICEIFYRQNRVSLVHLPTNGFYPQKIVDRTQKILGRCQNSEFIVSLPLDGFDVTHDRIKGVNGSFKKVIETTKSLAALKKKFDNLTINIVSVVNNINVDEMIKLAEFVKNNLPVDGHGLSPVRGSPYDKTLLPPSWNEWSSLSRKLMEYRKYWDRRRTGSKLRAFLIANRVKYLYNVYSRVLKGQKLPFKCQAGNIIAVLDPNGDVRLCELTKVVGNVRDTNFDFKKVLFSDEANAMRKKIKDCACTHACFLEPSIKMNPLTLFRSFLWGS